MLISYNWLKELVDIKLSPLELAAKMNVSGLLIEEITEIKPEATSVFVAKILSIEKHPNADTLSVCAVTDGKEQFQVVCGAQNIAVGQTVPLAKEGARLPGGLKIKHSKIRGVESFGMLCSAAELGLSDSAKGIFILDEKEHALGSPFEPVKPDTVYSIEVYPNRPDFLCASGIARFISSITGAALKMPDMEVPSALIDSSLKIKNLVTVDVLNASACPRYCARAIEGITVKDSPAWLQEALTKLGIRPINNIVDATNYVLLELNQPLHAFDHKKIKDGKIIVRNAAPQEKITALDGKVYGLKETDLVIADSAGPIAIAGVMGGEHFSVDESTKTVILESAYFNPPTVRKTSRSLGVSSDSSYRFERGIDINNVINAMNRAAALIAKLSGGSVSGDFIDLYHAAAPQKRAEVSFSRVNSLLGTSFNPDEICSLLSRLHFEYEKSENKASVIIPFYRPDIELEVDIIEDIAQAYGYDNIPTTLPSSAVSPAKEPSQDILCRRLSESLRAAGFSECFNYGFLNDKFLKDSGAASYSPAGAVILKNPFNEEESRMKTSLIPDLIKNMIFNRNNETEDIHLFESTVVFSRSDTGYEETPFLAAVSTGHIIRPGYTKETLISSYSYVKGCVETLLKKSGIKDDVVFAVLQDASPFYEYSASICAGSENLGVIGRIKEEILYNAKIKNPAFAFELNISGLLKAAGKSLRFTPVSLYPAVKRDLSLVLPADVPAQEVLSVIRRDGGGLVREISLFDVYRGSQVPDGYKSLSYSIVFRSDKKTLSEADVSKTFDRITDVLKTGLNARLRS